MALITRTIDNSGSPLTDVNGNLLAATVIRFTLVNARSYAAGTFDVDTGEPVAPGPWQATTDDEGLFTVALWPTSRGLEERFYLVEIAPESESVKFPAFKAPLIAGALPLPFVAFRLGGDTVTAWEMDAFTAHVQDTSIHGGGTGSAVILYQPEPPENPVDGTVWIDSDEDNYTRSMGSSALDFGAGAKETTATVTGQSGILATSACHAYMMADTTGDHSADEHRAELIDLVCGNIVPGTGFTIYATVRHGIAAGVYKIRWNWE
jgi:hypothetical protein